MCSNTGELKSHSLRHYTSYKLTVHEVRCDNRGIAGGFPVIRWVGGVLSGPDSGRDWPEIL
jgi:hypothetical protein